MSTFTQTQVAATVAACIGKRLSLETLKDIARTHGADGLKAFGEACRVEFATRFAHIVASAKGDSFAYMQKAKVPGVSTFYTYYCAVLKLQTIGETKDASALAEMEALTTGKLTSGKGKGKGAKPAQPADSQPQTVPLTIEDCIAFLQTAQKLGGLTPAHYAALQALIPGANVKQMGEVVEMPTQAPALLAAA